MIPIELPVKANEAAALADLIFQHLQGRSLNDETRTSLAARAAGLELASLQVWFGSLSPDPVHSSAFFVAIDAFAEGKRIPLLLHFAPASAPASALFPNSVL
ncbi:MAG: hypothetical protein NTY38_27765, partial [Acidobacteria bacterium]|nr:hypothetical protein [Acidobacteriota bacterium]